MSASELKHYLSLLKQVYLEEDIKLTAQDASIIMMLDKILKEKPYLTEKALLKLVVGVM